MNWFNQCVEWLDAFFSRPVPILCCSVGALIVLILTIISKTSIGKKSLRQLKQLYSSLVGEYKSYKDESEKVIKELTNAYETKLALIESKKEETEQLLLNIANCINNKKVKELVDAYKGKSHLTEISDVVKLQVEKVKDEYLEKVAELETRLLKLEELENGGQETTNN